MDNARHRLDNAVWSALCSRQSHLAVGQGPALRFGSDYSIFAAIPDHDGASLAALGELLATTGPAFIFERDPLPLVPGTRVEKRALGIQMLAEHLKLPDPDFAFLELGDADAAEMLALANLTEPGPFFTRTHRLGNFIGIRRDGVLIAMAGERLKCDGFTEVSGVCTHPDHRGKGLAGALMAVVAHRIGERGETPFLHAYADNKGAIALYESLGYRIRCDVHVTVLAPA